MSTRRTPHSSHTASEIPAEAAADAPSLITVTHRAESVSAQTAFAVQTADLCLRAGLRHSLKEWPDQTQTEKKKLHSN